MKKWISGVCTAAFIWGCLCMTVCAQTRTDVSLTGSGTVELSVTDDCGGALYTVYLLKPGSEPADISGGSSNAFIGLEELQTIPENGGRYAAAESNFVLDSAAEYGVYTAVFGGGELSGRAVRFAFPDKQTESRAVAEAGAADAGGLEEVLNHYQGSAWALDFERDIYKNAQKTVLENMKEILAHNVSSASQVSAAYTTACILADLKICDPNELYSILFLNEAILKIDYTDMLREESAEIQRVFFGLRKTGDMTTTEALQKLLRAAEAVARVNAASRDGILQLLRDYNDVFGLSFDGDFERVDTYQLSKKLEVDETPYDNPEQVREKFVKSIDELSSADSGKDSNSSNSSNSSNGGGGGSWTIGGEPAINHPEVTADKVQKVENKPVFLDLESAEWAKPYILYLAENNIMQGDGDGYFRPEDPVLREEMLKLLLEAFKPQDQGGRSGKTFEDVQSGIWYEPYVETGVHLGIVRGISETNFGSGLEVSRQDAAVMFVRTLEACGRSLIVTQEPTVFSDGGQIEEYAAAAVETLQRAGVISGYNNGDFRPQNAVTRAEAAKMIYGVIKGFADGKEQIE